MITSFVMPELRMMEKRIWRGPGARSGSDGAAADDGLAVASFASHKVVGLAAPWLQLPRLLPGIPLSRDGCNHGNGGLVLHLCVLGMRCSREASLVAEPRCKFWRMDFQPWNVI